MSTNLPKRLQAVLWSRDINKLDLKKDKNYIIHQILAYGTWEQLIWLFKVYDAKLIKQIFRKSPEKDYTEKSFNFAKDILLEISEDIDRQSYVKTLPRNIRR